MVLVPTICADRGSPSDPTTITLRAPATTWALVRTWPSASITTPVPAPAGTSIASPSSSGWGCLRVTVTPLDSTASTSSETSVRTTLDPPSPPVIVVGGSPEDVQAATLIASTPITVTGQRSKTMARSLRRRHIAPPSTVTNPPLRHKQCDTFDALFSRSGVMVRIRLLAVSVGKDGQR